MITNLRKYINKRHWMKAVKKWGYQTLGYANLRSWQIWGVQNNTLKLSTVIWKHRLAKPRRFAHAKSAGLAVKTQHNQNHAFTSTGRICAMYGSTCITVASTFHCRQQTTKNFGITCGGALEKSKVMTTKFVWQYFNALIYRFWHFLFFVSQTKTHSPLKHSGDPRGHLEGTSGEQRTEGSSVLKARLQVVLSNRYQFAKWKNNNS